MKKPFNYVKALGGISLMVLATSVYAADAAQPAAPAPAPPASATPPAPPGPNGSGVGPNAVNPDAPLPAPPAPGVVATVNGTNISRDELVDYVMKQYGSTVLEQLIDRRIVEQSAQKQGIDVSKADIDATYAEIQTTSGPALSSYEKRYGKEFVIQNVIKPQVIRKKLAEKLVTFNSADLDEVRASHILIRPAAATDAAGKAKADADAKKKADDLYAKAKAPGADFAALAKENSDDPGSKTRGGDLDYFGHGQMVPEFDAAAFAAKTGDIIGPVKTSYGYHIIKIVDRREATKMSAAQLEAKKTQYLLKKASEPINDWLDRQRKSAQVQRYKMDSATASASN